MLKPADEYHLSHNEYVPRTSKLLDEIRLDLISARKSLSNTRSSNLEELLFLLQQDNFQKKVEIENLRNQLTALNDSKASETTFDMNEEIELERREKIYLELELVRQKEIIQGLCSKFHNLEDYLSLINSRNAELEVALKAASLRLREKFEECSSIQIKLEESERYSRSIELSQIDMAVRVRALENKLLEFELTAQHQKAQEKSEEFAQFLCGSGTPSTSLYRASNNPNLTFRSNPVGAYIASPNSSSPLRFSKGYQATRLSPTYTSPTANSIARNIYSKDFSSGSREKYMSPGRRRVEAARASFNGSHESASLESSPSTLKKNREMNEMASRAYLKTFEEFNRQHQSLPQPFLHSSATYNAYHVKTTQSSPSLATTTAIPLAATQVNDPAVLASSRSSSSIKQESPFQAESILLQSQSVKTNQVQLLSADRSRQSSESRTGVACDQSQYFSPPPPPPPPPPHHLHLLLRLLAKVERMIVR